MAEEVGLGVTINPVAFLVINKESIKLMPINHSSTLDKIIDYIPDILENFTKKDKKKKCKENEEEGKDKAPNIEVKAEVQKTEVSNDYLEDE